MRRGLIYLPNSAKRAILLGVLFFAICLGEGEYLWSQGASAVAGSPGQPNQPHIGTDAFQFSMANQISPANIGELELRWSARIDEPDAPLEGKPVVQDGLVYVTGSWSVVVALDAVTGHVVWRWDPQVPRYGLAGGGPVFCCGPVNRGVAVGNGRVFVGVLDGRLVSLDAKTGERIWEEQTSSIELGYSITGSPLLVGDMVLIGNGGAEFGVRGYVSAFDQRTGEMLWRFYTVPGNPELGFECDAMEFAASTWSGRWWEVGGGGTVWDGMAYDPEAELIYIGVGNGGPWSRKHRSNGAGDNLFLASIVALRPANGELVWYYQTTPGDQWDYTATQNIVLADLAINGSVRKVLMQAPKNGFFYVLDRITGEYLSAKPFAAVSWADSINRDGVPIERSYARYDEQGTWISPGPTGAHSWPPMAWDPLNRTVYIPAENNVAYFREDTTFRANGLGYNLGARLGSSLESRPLDPSSFLLAWDPVEQREKWRVPSSSFANGGVLATASGIVFHGTSDGVFHAFHAVAGRELWSFRIGRRPATPVSYTIAGTQLIFILSGGSLWAFALEGR